MTALRNPTTGSIIQATGRLETRLLAAGWTVTDQPASPGLHIITAAELEALASTVSNSFAASQADRTDLRQTLEPIALELPQVADEVDQLVATVEATTTAAAPKPTPRTDALEAWRTEAEPIIDGLHPVATSGSYTALGDKPSLLQIGTTGTTAAAGNDARLSDARAPTAHTHPVAQVTGLHAVATSGSYNDLTDTPAPGGGSGSPTVKLAADHAAFTATALANVTGLSFPVVAGTIYRYTFWVVFRTAATTTGARLGVTCPAFTTHAGSVRLPMAADGTAHAFHGALNASGDSVVSTAVAAATTDFLAIVEGVLVPSANGTLQLQAATEIANSALTVRAGSNGILTTV